MKILLILFTIYLLTITAALAQHEADNWYFGSNAGISFKNGTVKTLDSGKINTLEGCAAISDKNTGELLFYTNGEYVWNNQHQLMKEGFGLKGGNSSTQSALIVPNPVNKLQYYIFTAPDLSSDWPPKSFKCYFSIVSLETPEGEILSKNTYTEDTVSEKITGTIDCEGTGYWIILHHAFRGKFFAYHLTPKGLISKPVISVYGSETNGFYGGYMKISPDNTKIALASTWDKETNLISCLSLFDFNASTGEISNFVRLNNNNDKDSIFYGVSFSADNSKLYAGIHTSPTILQYEINLSSALSIRNSRFALKYDKGNNGALQLAPDGKLYFAKFEEGKGGLSYIGVINKPNLKGNACLLQSNAVKLTGKSLLGLPNFMDYIFNSYGVVAGPLSGCHAPKAATYSDSGCIGKKFEFFDRSTFKPTRREWFFENGVPSFSTDSIVSINYNQPGIHKVKLVAFNDKGSDTIYSKAIVYPLPTANAGFDKTICLGDSIQIGGIADSGNTYSWQPQIGLDDPTKSNPYVTPITTTQYILEVKNSTGCIAYDTVLVTVGSIKVKVTSDTSLCLGSSVQLLATGGSDYEWTPTEGLNNPNIPNPTASPIVTTTYKVRVSSGTCDDFATVKVTVNPLPTANAGPDLMLCKGETSQLGASPQDGYKYQWQPTTGLDDPTKSNPFVTPLESTKYILTVTNNNGCTSTDTAEVLIRNTLTAIVSTDTSVCLGSSVQLSASGGTLYQWSPIDGLDNPTSSHPIATPKETTQYKVIVSNGFCTDSVFVRVTIKPVPLANAGPDLTLCRDETSQLGIPPQDGYKYNWQPITGLDDPTKSNPTVTAMESVEYILTVSNTQGCQAKDSVTITVSPKDEYKFTLSPKIIIFTPGTSFQTDLNIPRGVQTWKVLVTYDKFLFKFSDILQTSKGITVTAQDLNGQLELSGAGGNGKVKLKFNTYLPNTTDTTFKFELTVDTLTRFNCSSIISEGNTLQLGEYCGRRVRMVNSTGKQYSLTANENSINFGVGLSGNVKLELYDYCGIVKQILVNEPLDVGEYSVNVDLPTGLYFCRISSGKYEHVTKVMVIR